MECSYLLTLAMDQMEQCCAIKILIHEIYKDKHITTFQYGMKLQGNKEQTH